MLNYLTAPHVYVWSAVSCSSAFPLLFAPQVLKARDADGHTVTCAACPPLCILPFSAASTAPSMQCSAHVAMGCCWGLFLWQWGFAAIRCCCMHCSFRVSMGSRCYLLLLHAGFPSLVIVDCCWLLP